MEPATPQPTDEREVWHDVPQDFWARFRKLLRERWQYTQADFFADTQNAGIAEKTVRRAADECRITEESLKKLAKKLGFNDDWQALLVLLGGNPPTTVTTTTEISHSTEPRKSIAKEKLKKAQELIRGGDEKAGRATLDDALRTARVEKNNEEVVQILAALVLTAPDGRRTSPRKELLAEAEALLPSIKSNAIRVLYHLAKARIAQDESDDQEHEAALRDALRSCESAKGKEEGMDDQACVIRASLVHLLCDLKRNEEAGLLLTTALDHARRFSEDEDAELLQAALLAGIHLSTYNKEHEVTIGYISELEGVAREERRAKRIHWELIEVANRLSHRDSHASAIAAAEAATRLARKIPDDEQALLVAVYTCAAATFRKGDWPDAKRKAEAVRAACIEPRDNQIKHAADHLIAEMARQSGDSETAVAFAMKALEGSSRDPESLAATKQAVARALSDNGQTEEALSHAIHAFELMKASGAPVAAVADVLFQIVSYSSTLGKTSEEQLALTTLSSLQAREEHLETIKDRAPKLAEMNRKLRQRVIQISSPSTADSFPKIDDQSSLAHSNAEVVRPLFQLWNDLPKKYQDSGALCYDFWGRGNFARILRNSQSFPGAFNVTLEVRSLDEVKRAVRLWALYADVLLLIWKGHTDDRKRLDVIPTPPGGPGGAEYILGSPIEANGRKYGAWMCIIHASLLPPEVVSFLMNEAKSLLAAGRLFIVPAPGVGCVHPGHGPLEQLVSESANAVAGLRGSAGGRDLQIGLMPYSPDVPFDVLGDVVESQQNELKHLRRLMLQRTREFAPVQAGILARKELALEIEDALQQLSDLQDRTSRKRGTAKGMEAVSGTYCRFRKDAKRLLSSIPTTNTAFAPLLTMQNFGYRWGISSPDALAPGRYEPGEQSVIGPWLALPTEGWAILAVKKESSQSTPT